MDAIETPPKKKRRKPVRLDALTVKWLEARGWCAGIVERRYGRFSHDWKGFADILAVKKDRATVGVQVCRDTTRAEHVEKLLTGDGAPGCRQFLAQGSVIAIVSWDKRADYQGPGKKSTGREVWRITGVLWVRFAYEDKADETLRVTCGAAEDFEA